MSCSDSRLRGLGRNLGPERLDRNWEFASHLRALAHGRVALSGADGGNERAARPDAPQSIVSDETARQIARSRERRWTLHEAMGAARSLRSSKRSSPAGSEGLDALVDSRPLTR